MGSPQGSANSGLDPSPLTREHLERWSRLLPASPAARLSTGGDTARFSIETPDGPGALVEISSGAATVRPLDGDQTDFSLLADSEDWRRFFLAVPPPLFHSIFAMRMRVPTFAIRGDERRFAQFVGHVRRALEVGRVAANDAPAQSASSASALDLRGISGSYVDIQAAGHRSTVYVEQSGHGPDLFLLHTAGSDSRQLHPLLADPRLTSRFRITAFDLPGHGRSASVPGQLDGDYSLTLEAYRGTVVAVVDALGLDRPVVCGASMAGEICLELALSAPTLFSGIVACEASDHVPGRRTPWMDDPTIDTTIFAPEWIHGLLGPESPDQFKNLVLWTYSQGGAGTFAGDIDFYSGGWDARDRITDIDTGITPLVLMTGEYDYSCTPEMSEATAARIRGAHFVQMPGLGHFPLSENPDRFIPHLLQAVDTIRQESRSAA